MKRAELRCHYCGLRAPLGTRLTQDHVVPVSMLRRLNPEEVLLNATGLAHLSDPPRSWREVAFVRACVRCNNAKADRRSTCECWVCDEAWARFEHAVGRLVPMTWQMRRGTRRQVVLR